MLSASFSKVTFGFQANLSRAFAGSATKISTSAGRKKHGSMKTWSSIFKFSSSKTICKNSQTVWAYPVPITKSSGFSCWSIVCIIFTYSPEKPQSLCASMFPNRNSVPIPNLILAAAEEIFWVTYSKHLLGDSWLRSNPVQVNNPYASR